MSKKVKILIVTLIVVVLAAGTTVGFALWTGAVNPQSTITIKAGEPISIKFGEKETAIKGEIMPGGSVQSDVQLKANGKPLKVKYAITLIEVMYKDATEFVTVSDKKLITLAVYNGDNLTSGEETKVTFKFTMKEDNAFTYVEAKFKITVKATATIAQ